MEKYRKPDQYYIDNYDRYTIQLLKKIEQEDGRIWSDLYSNNKNHQAVDGHNPLGKFYETAVSRSSNKNDSIESLIRADERKDHLINMHPIPQLIKCNICTAKMLFSTYLFKDNDTKLIFLFDCPNGHIPKKGIYSNGNEYFFPKRKCQICEGEYSSESKKNEDKLICIDTCKKCGKVVITELDLNIREEEPIDEVERKKYCTYFIGKQSFTEALQETYELSKSIERYEKEKNIKNEYEVDKIEKPKIPQLELRLSELAEKLGYIKFQFEKPDTRRQLIVPFNTQDSTDKDSTESIKILTKAINQTLFHTNWRLMSPGISYRMGYLSGQLKAHESDEDLLKIAKKIKNKMSD